MRFIYVAACVVFAGLTGCGEKQTDPAHEPKAPPVVDAPAAPGSPPVPNEPATPTPEAPPSGT